MSDATHHADAVGLNQLDAGASAFFAELVGLAFALVMVVAAVRAARYRRSARTEREAAKDETLAPGLRVVSGVVEYADGADHAVRVEIDQEGSESESSGSWSHSWNEKRRRVKVKPFFVQTDRGARVRVIPPEDVVFVDALDQKILVSYKERTLAAELSPGERVWVQGELQGGDQKSGVYRGGRDPLLVAPPGGKMLVSSEPLGQRLEKRAGVHRAGMRLAGFGFVVVELTYAPFHRRMLFGRTETWSVEGLVHRVEKDGEGDTVHTCHATLRSPTGATLSEELDCEYQARLHEGDTVPVRGGHIGAGATLHSAHVLLTIGTPLAFFLIYQGIRSASRPWYRRPVSESGSGKLPRTGNEEETTGSS